MRFPEWDIVWPRIAESNQVVGNGWPRTMAAWLWSGFMHDAYEGTHMRRSGICALYSDSSAS